MSEFQGAERDAGEGLLRRLSGPPRVSSHPRLCVAVFLSSFCFFLAVPLIPLYLVELGPRAALAGPTIAVSFILSAVLSPVWARLADRFGPKPMMIRAAVLVSVAYVLSALATSVEMENYVSLLQKNVLSPAPETPRQSCGSPSSRPPAPRTRRSWPVTPIEYEAILTTSATEGG